jgi:hypothetical protein
MRHCEPQILLTLVEGQHVDCTAFIEKEIDHHVYWFAAALQRDRRQAAPNDRWILSGAQRGDQNVAPPSGNGYVGLRRDTSAFGPIL